MQDKLVMLVDNDLASVCERLTSLTRRVQFFHHFEPKSDSKVIYALFHILCAIGIQDIIRYLKCELEEEE